MLRAFGAARIVAGFTCGFVLLPHARSAPGPGQTAPDLAPGHVLDAASAKKIVEDVREAGIPGNYYLEFELQVLPRRGPERTLRARLWGSRNEAGAITRVAVGDATAAENRFLLQNGTAPAAWKFANGAVQQLSVRDTFVPLVSGIEITPFDLEMPFLYWPDFAVEGVTRLAGRPTQAFRFRPPAAFAAQFPQLGAVRAYLDTQFHAPVQTEMLSPQGKVMKTITLVDAKRVGDQWMLKTLDVRNDVTRDKTRLQITAAGLRLDFSPTLFEPATLAEEIKSPPTDHVERLAP